jgi:hypothetical protein
VSGWDSLLAAGYQKTLEQMLQPSTILRPMDPLKLSRKQKLKRKIRNKFQQIRERLASRIAGFDVTDRDGY